MGGVFRIDLFVDLFIYFMVKVGPLLFKDSILL